MMIPVLGKRIAVDAYQFMETIEIQLYRRQKYKGSRKITISLLARTMRKIHALYAK
jgi:hypothetical protein